MAPLCNDQRVSGRLYASIPSLCAVDPKVLLLLVWQGLCVSFLFCFCNGEVLQVIRKELVRYATSRKIGLRNRRLGGGNSSSAVTRQTMTTQLWIRGSHKSLSHFFVSILYNYIGIIPFFKNKVQKFKQKKKKDIDCYHMIYCHALNWIPFGHLDFSCIRCCRVYFGWRESQYCEDMYTF